MTKSRQRLLLDTLNGKCTTGSELARQLLNELDACGPFTTAAHGYRASNGQFARRRIVQAWTVRQTIKSLATLPQAPIAHGLYEAHVAMKGDAPIRTTATSAEQRHTNRVELWNRPIVFTSWDSEEGGQAQNDYLTITAD
jgi:hypothetical protein